MEKEWWIQAEDDTAIYVKKWYKEAQKPKAIIQIAHGMAEHIQRYKPFANYLMEQNIFVYGNDHRGHGQTGVKQGLFGFFSKTDGFVKTTADLYEVTKQIKQDHPNTPLFLYGHSMGSFLARRYIQDHSRAIDGVILSGTGFHSFFTTQLGKTIARILPPGEKSNLMNTLAFGSYNKKTTNKTAFDWLTNDETAVQTYIDDPHAGFVPTARFFYDLMDGLQDIRDQKRNATIQKDLPMLLVSGDADPVGDYAKGVWKTADLYEHAGLVNIVTMLFADRRHELLHEQNKQEVYTAIYQWLKRHFDCYSC